MSSSIVPGRVIVQTSCWAESRGVAVAVLGPLAPVIERPPRPVNSAALYIADDELQPRADIARLHELCPQLLYGKTVGSGHFCQLEVPEQVNATIERFLTITLP